MQRPLNSLRLAAPLGVTLGLIGLFAVGVLGKSDPVAPGGVVTQYIDPKQQTALWFGARSHWLQPWRAYLETVPTARLREAVGINLNVEPQEAEATCRHLAQHGFRQVRVEFGWATVSWEHPDRLADPTAFNQVVGACRKYHLRPLFLLNAHHGAPCPMRTSRIRLLQPAFRGDRTVQLDPEGLSGLIPGRSGVSNLTDYWAAEVIFTQIDPDGTVQLSKPLPKDLPAGDMTAVTLKYLPFYPAKRLADGAVPPEFTETMQGWLSYVEAIATQAKAVLGTDGAGDAGFDFECWNELTFGSHFLTLSPYYEQPPVTGEDALVQIRAQTVAYVTDPAHRLPGVGVCDGFNNQWPWGAGSISPPGLAALGKHPYRYTDRFPQDQPYTGTHPLDALGNWAGTEVSPGTWVDAFVPTYVSLFPEYYLTAIQTEHVIRDISPIVTDIYGGLHGRATHPFWPDGRPAPAPQFWVTEVNLDFRGADPGLPADAAVGSGPSASPQGASSAAVAPDLTPADVAYLKAKMVLRYLVSYVNKGAARLYFFAAKDEDPMGLGLVSQAFYSQLRTNGYVSPRNVLPVTSPAMMAVRRLVTAMPGGTGLHGPRSLALLRIAERHGHKQFEGDPATVNQVPNPRPPLYNRDVLAFLPFQATDTAFVVPLYVMTRNLAHLYQPGAPATDVTRFDLPDERYELTIGGVRGTGARLSLYDPLTGKKFPVQRISAGTNQLTVEVPLTDSPRLLILEEVTPPAVSRTGQPRGRSA
jgi:hypothetical protein